LRQNVHGSPYCEVVESLPASSPPAANGRERCVHSGHCGNSEYLRRAIWWKCSERTWLRATLAKLR
jgi:hypothetical protein